MNDVFLEFEYDIDKDEFKNLKTNAKKPKNILENYLRTVVGCGEDHRKAKQKSTYKIRIELDLSCDKFSCSSDTGNDGLTTGIIMLYYSKF